jgi:hypothetical protein
MSPQTLRRLCAAGFVALTLFAATGTAATAQTHAAPLQTHA